MTSFTHRSPSTRWRLAVPTVLAAFAFAVGGAAASAAALVPAASASASSVEAPAPAVAAAAATATTGWLRLAHLSPDTSAVDIQLSALAGGSVTKSLSDIGYGAVSPYMALAPGTYVVAMVPAGGDFALPVITASVTVVAGQPLTVAAYGKNADLSTAVFHDDLTTPSAGQSRVRVVQASTIVPSVTIQTSTGMAIGTNIAEGTATDYASVPGGAWKLDLTSGTVRSSADVDLQAGSVSTLFVLDDASGGLALKSVLDSSSAGDLPIGGVQTGGGGTALVHTGAAALGTGTAVMPIAAVEGAAPPARRMLDVAVGAVGLVAAVVGVIVYRRRTRSSLGRLVGGRRAEPAFRQSALTGDEAEPYEPAVRGRLPESYQRHDRQWYDNLARELQERERLVRLERADGLAE